MPGEYRIYGAEMSPYSVKVRSYFRYKEIPHRWIVRNVDTQPEYEKYAKIPIIPLVVTPSDEGRQDSTPIIEALEAEYPEPSVHPGDPVAAFVSCLLEEFGDEWGNKWMFHYRWAREVDQLCSAGRLARMMMPSAADADSAALAEQIRSRMVDRVWFVGSNEQTAPQIEDSFRRGVELLDAHLDSRPYLFGDRPAFGDFGLWGQLYCAWTDPTPAAIIEGTAPRLLDWIHRMLRPAPEGEFESWAQLAPTLEPFLREQVGGMFVPWTLANERAMAGGGEEFSVELAGRTWVQKPQKYHVKSLAALREKYARRGGGSDLDDLLERTGCMPAFAG